MYETVHYLCLTVAIFNPVFSYHTVFIQGLIVLKYASIGSLLVQPLNTHTPPQPPPHHSYPNPVPSHTPPHPPPYHSYPHPNPNPVLPTPEYLSPELIFNLGHDQSSDLWAFGEAPHCVCTLYCWLRRAISARTPPNMHLVQPPTLFESSHIYCNYCPFGYLGVLVYEMVMASTPFAPKKADNVTELFTNIAMVTVSWLNTLILFPNFAIHHSTLHCSTHPMNHYTNVATDFLLTL